MTENPKVAAAVGCIGRLREQLEASRAFALLQARTLEDLGRRAEDLRRALARMVERCPECGGTGESDKVRITLKAIPGGDVLETQERVPCPACGEARRVVEGSAPGILSTE